MDSHATGQDNSSNVHLTRGYLAKVTQVSASHQESPPANAVVKGLSCTIYPSGLAAGLDGFVRVIRKSSCDCDHELDKRRRLEYNVRPLEFEHENSRANNAALLLENERQLYSVCNELKKARQVIVQYHGTISSLHNQVLTLFRDNKNLKGIHENIGYFRRSKPRSRVLSVRTKTSYVKCRMRTHSAWQFDRVCIR